MRNKLERILYQLLLRICCYLDKVKPTLTQWRTQNGG